MFLDEKKHGEAATKTPSLRGLIAWLETQDPTTEYRWGNISGGCLIGRYGASIGYTMGDMCRNRPESDLTYYDICVGDTRAVALRMPHTFGAALDRARECLADQ
jgi:hypothetical protein